ncbi:MAG: hypothetical protein AAFZ01_12070, partial [Pseudomonadota bacterium]
EPALKRMWYPARYAGGEETAPLVRRDAEAEVRVCLTALNGKVAELGPHLLGAQINLADITLAYWYASVAHLDGMAALDALAAHVAHVYARPKLRPFATQAAEMVAMWESGADMSALTVSGEK